MGDSANAQPEAEDRAHARQLGFTGGRFLARKPVVFPEGLYVPPL